MRGPERGMNGRAPGRGARQSWRSLRSDPDYVADWRANAGRPDRAGPPFPFRRQTVADLKAARWNLLAWEDPHDPSRASPFWADAPVLDARVVPASDAGGYGLSDVARRTGARFTGLWLRDGTLIVKFVRDGRTVLFRVVDGEGFDPARSGLAIACTGGDAPGGGSRLESLDAALLGR